MKIEYPEGVIDRKAYVKFLAFDRHPDRKNYKMVCSDGTEIALNTFPHYLKKQIEHLPPKEQELILEKKRKYQVATQRRNMYYGLAYGKLGPTSEKRKQAQKDAKQAKQEALEDDIVTLLGRMFSVNEVVRIIAEDNQIPITKTQVQDVLKKNLTTIERKREEFRNKVTDVRLYNKRPRLEELAWMFGKMKMRYISTGGEGAYNAMLRTLEQIRKEAEGDILSVKGALDVNLNVELQAHIQKEVIKTINIREIILGRIAARMNYDTTKLIAGLHNSYYNRFTQISGDYDADAEIQYPSLINYDFNEIEKRNKDVDDVKTMENEPLKEEQHDEAQRIKDLFLSHIRRDKQSYEQRTATAVVEEDDFEVSEDYDEMKRNGRRMRYDAKLKKEKRKAYEISEESREKIRKGAQHSNEVQRKHRNNE